MTISEWLTVFSTLLSPLFALQVSQMLERRRGARNRREQIFKTLVSTRAAPLSSAHVEALNMIDVEFDGPSNKVTEVTRAWEAYHDHLNHQFAKTSFDVWMQKKDDLFVELLFQMAIHLGYDFNRTRLKNSAYAPSVYLKYQMDQETIREGLAAVFKGERDFPVALSLNNPLTPGSSAVLPAVAATSAQTVSPNSPIGAGQETVGSAPSSQNAPGDALKRR